MYIVEDFVLLTLITSCYIRAQKMLVHHFNPWIYKQCQGSCQRFVLTRMFLRSINIVVCFKHKVHVQQIEFLQGILYDPST